MRLSELLNSAEVIGVKKMACVLQLFTTGEDQRIQLFFLLRTRLYQGWNLEIKIYLWFQQCLALI